MTKCITQMGSLPFDNVQQAVAYSLRHDIPFLPELPLLGDSMLDYIKQPGKLSCLAEFKRCTFATVKVQCVGPATLTMAGYGEDEAIQRIYNHIARIINGLAAEEVILFLDEPALGQAGFEYQSLWSALFSSFKVISGVHCCGNMDWDILFKSDVEIISFDASSYDLTKYPFYRNGKRIAWGIANASDIKDFSENDLITLPCGMSPLVYRASYCGDALRNLQSIKRHFNV
jgi:hypothetical protein